MFIRGLLIHVVKENKIQGTVHKFLGTPPLGRLPCGSWQYAVGKEWRRVASWIVDHPLSGPEMLGPIVRVIIFGRHRRS